MIFLIAQLPINIAFITKIDLARKLRHLFDFVWIRSSSTHIVFNVIFALETKILNQWNWNQVAMAILHGLHNLNTQSVLRNGITLALKTIATGQ